VRRNRNILLSDFVETCTINGYGISICPSCGSRRIEKLRRNWDGNFEGKHYVVPDLEYYECPACGECVFGREAMRKIEARSPAFERTRMKRSA